MTTAWLFLVGSTVTFITLFLLYSIEVNKGKRVLFPRLRGRLDKITRWLHYAVTVRVINWFWLVWQLMINYGARKLLRFITFIVVSSEHKIESLLRHNKLTKREARPDRLNNHLDDIAAHKAESALTDKQRDKLKMH